MFKNCFTPGPKVIGLRCGHKDFTQVMLWTNSSEELDEVSRQSVEKQRGCGTGFSRAWAGRASAF